MIIKFSNHLLERWLSIIKVNIKEILFFIVWSSLMYLFEHVMLWNWISIPMTPVALLGGGLAIFLGFRNNSAYDRWWEARKLWGGIVNVSRTFSANAISFLPDKINEAIVKRHLAYVYALKIQQREISSYEESFKFISESESILYLNKKNTATAILAKQSQVITDLKRTGVIDAFEHKILMENISSSFDLQGGLERILKTVFPFFYKYFTRTFLWLFMIVLPMSLVHEMGWQSIPLSVAISFVYMVLDKIGDVTENPLKGRSSGTPISSICRTIEIDLLQMLESDFIPEPLPIKQTRHKSSYLD